MSSFGDSLIKSMKEALAYAKGEPGTENFKVHTINIDVKKIRKNLNMTQKYFAHAFGFSVDTVRHWEQKRRMPEGPAKAYLMVISKRPEMVQEALKEATESEKRIQLFFRVQY